MTTVILAVLLSVVAFIVIVKLIQGLGKRYGNRDGGSVDDSGVWMTGAAIDNSASTSGEDFSGNGGDFGGGGADAGWSDGGSDSGSSDSGGGGDSSGGGD